MAEEKRRTEDGYSRGDRAYYHGDGETLRVKVLANLSNDERIEYRLRVLEAMDVMPRVAYSRRGEEFECWKRRDVQSPYLWWIGEF